VIFTTAFSRNVSIVRLSGARQTVCNPRSTAETTSFRGHKLLVTQIPLSATQYWPMNFSIRGNLLSAKLLTHQKKNWRLRRILCETLSTSGQRRIRTPVKNYGRQIRRPALLESYDDDADDDMRDAR